MGKALMMAGDLDEADEAYKAGTMEVRRRGYTGGNGWGLGGGVLMMPSSVSVEGIDFSGRV